MPASSAQSFVLLSNCDVNGLLPSWLTLLPRSPQGVANAKAVTFTRRGGQLVRQRQVSWNVTRTSDADFQADHNSLPTDAMSPKERTRYAERGGKFTHSNSALVSAVTDGET